MLSSDNELPGMWSHSDFTGGDPDERSYAERERSVPEELHALAGERYRSEPEFRAMVDEVVAILAALRVEP